MRVYVVGISGVSGGGKSTLARKLLEYFSDRKNANVFDKYCIKQAKLIAQDQYFYPMDSPHHTWIEDMNFINRELLSAIDGERFWTSIANSVSQLREVGADADDKANAVCILLVEGFLIFNDDRINELCDLHLHLKVSPEEGLKRRLYREAAWKHANPDPVKYFKKYVWPSYEKHHKIVKNRDQIHHLNGEDSREELLEQSLRIIDRNIN